MSAVNEQPTPLQIRDTPKAEGPRVGLLGVGLMGSAMAHRLLSEEIQVVAWDRDAARVHELRQRGADAAGSGADAVSGADVVITMLPTAEIVQSVVEPLLPDWPDRTTWLQMSSVGAAESDELTQLATEHDVVLFDAPVSGSTHPAEEGQLTILASGPAAHRSRVEPVLEALGSRVLWVGEAGVGSRLKLATNHWMITTVAALAETMHVCQLMGLDQRQFAELLDGSPLGSPYGLQKLDEMRRHDYPAGFPVRLALKDLQLVHEVGETAERYMPLLEAALERMSASAETHPDDDLAAVYELDLPSRPHR